MSDILFCIRNDHVIQFVLLAAVVCALTSSTAVLVIRQLARATGRTAFAWMLAAGFSTGFGIWATHFIAMLGYDPGVIAGYRPLPTVSSLAIVVMTTMAGFGVAARCKSHACFAAGAVLTGAGFAAMHYVGMIAIEMPAEMRWHPGYVALSCALAIAPLYPALTLSASRQGAGSGAIAAALLATAILGLHFSGMTAISLVPGQVHHGYLLISPPLFSALVGAVSVVLLGLCFAAWFISRRTSAAIAASQRQFSILVKGISDCAIYMLDAQGTVASWNIGAERLKGYTEAEVVGLPLATFYTAQDCACDVPARAMRTALECGRFSGEGWRVRKDGSRFWAHVSIERLTREDGALAGFAKITRDMTRFKEDQDRIEQASLERDAALQHMQQGLCLFNAEGRLVLHNQQFRQIWKLPPARCLIGNTFVEVAQAAIEARTGAAVPPERLSRVQDTFAGLLADPHSPPIEYVLAEGFSVSICTRATADGGWVSTVEDITARRRAESQISYLAHHDGLTGIPNRASFQRWLDREMEQAAARRRKVALVTIDIDSLKDINDRHGHATGDAVLCRLADALRDAIDEGECAARLGGDELAVAKNFTPGPELNEFIARIEACFARSGEGAGPAVTASIGVAIYPDDAGDRDVLLSNAGHALARAKNDPARRLCYYQAGMDQEARRRHLLASDLRQAIARDEMFVLYQEQRNVRTGRLCGYEALLRWHHPVLDLIPPDEFIPVAEETGEILRIGEWVLRTACEEAVNWPHDVKLAVNVSPVQLRMPDLPEIVAQILIETGFSPSRLELEITESAIISDKLGALHSLRRIKALGIGVAMDDFGTGYSSLDTLHSFPFDKIKIDKSFLLQSDGSTQARAIIRAVLALGRSIGVPVLAEGVETSAQLSLLEKEGCAEAQGYLFGRPASAPSIQEWQYDVA